MASMIESALAARLGHTPTEQQYGQPAPASALGHVVDFISRPNYASASFFDTLMSEEGLAIGRALSNGAGELMDPEERLTFSDLIKKHDPAFADKHPVATGVVGFMGDVALDPTTYLGVGVARGATKITIPAVRNITRTIKPGRKVVNKLAGLPDAIEPAKGFRRSKTVQNLFGKQGDMRFKKLRTLKDEVGVEARDTIADRVFHLNKQGMKMHDDFVRQELKEGWDLSDKGIDMAIEMAQDRVDRLGGSIDEAFEYAVADVLKAAQQPKNSVKNWGSTIPVVQAERAAEKRTAAALSAMAPESLAKVIDKGGIKIGGKTILAGDKIGAAAESIRLISGLSWLKHTRPVTALRHSFIRHADIPKELIDAEKSFHVSLQKHELDTISQAERMFSKLDGKQREKIGTLGHELDAWANDLRFKQHKSPKEVETAVNRLIKRADLTTQERDVLVNMTQHMQRLAKTEQEANLLHHARQVYFPRYYEALKDRKGYQYLRNRMRAGMSEAFDRDLARKFRTIKEAKDHGFDPVLDAGVLYTRRVMDSHRALARARFNETLKTVLPEMEEFAGMLRKLDLDEIDPKLVQAYIKGLPANMRHIAQHVNFIGDGLYNRFAPDEFNYMLRGMDKMMNLFRASATVARPAFGARQTVSNTFQSFVGAGIKGLRHVTVDPQASLDSFLAMNGKTDFSFRSVFGRKWSGAEFVQAAADNNILRNVSIEGIGKGSIAGPKGARKLMKEIDRVRIAQERFGDNDAARGMGKLLSGVLDYVHVPSMIEDWGRLTMFGNMLRHGHDTTSAAKMVDEALFDYTHGLAKFEERFVRRFVPFYSYQRFAIPLVTRAAVQAPGRITNSVKAGKALMSAYGKLAGSDKGGEGGEPLTQAERAAIPGFLLEQPHVFAGWTKDMEARHAIFNNFTPLDVFGFVSSDEDGNLSIAETVSKVALSQLAPFVKVPLEFALKKDFFTGRAMEGAYRAGELDMDRLLGNLLGMGAAGVAAGRHQGSATIAGAAGKGFGELLMAVAPNEAKALMKQALMMEEGIDPYTGKKAVYFSPWAMHVLQSVLPGLNEAVKASRTDKTNTEKTAQFLFGIGTHKADLKRTQTQKKRSIMYEASDKKSDYQDAYIEGRHGEAQRALDDLRKYLADHTEDLDLLSQPVRGAIPNGQ